MPKPKLLVVFSSIFCFGIFTGTVWKSSLYSNGVNLNTSKSNKRVISSLFDNGNCKAQRNIMFLKTHKTGGTTIQNIIMRHVKRNNLYVGLPRGNDFRFKYGIGLKFERRFVSNAQHEINVLCHHMRFDRQQVSSLMPENTKYLTIVRDPAELFASFFDYFHFNCPSFRNLPQNTDGLLRWLSGTKKYFDENDRKPSWWYAKNGMAFDLGFDNLRDDDEYIQQAIVEMEKTFQLVLIKEFFEESVILMKDFLCLNLSEVRHLHLNSRVESDVKLPDQKIRDDIRQWNKLDTAIYNHFNKTFWKKVKKYGSEKMRKETEELRELNAKLQNMCIDGGVVEHNAVEDSRFRVFHPKGVETGGFNLKQEALGIPLCLEVAQIEKEWFRFIKQKQSHLS